MKSHIIYGIDFDGTVVTHEYPKVGTELPHVVTVLKALVHRGDRLILWTMRSGDTLEEAKDWFKEREIPLYGIQRNPDQDRWTESPKAYCHVYIDDAALGCPLVTPKKKKGRPYVDWEVVAELLGVKL